MIYLSLFLAFLKVGMFSFGGAYSAIPLIRDVVLSNDWMTEDDLAYMIAVSESTPGPLMVNLATYVGSVKGGLLGSAIATFAVVLPAFVIILLVLVLFRALLKNAWFCAALNAMKPCIAGIILAVGLCMIVENVTDAPDWKTVGLSAVLAGILFIPTYAMKKKISPILYIGIAAVLGAVVFSF